MSGRDYIRCKKCKAKIIYDGNKSVRNHLEDIWGDPKSDIWTAELLCPGCVQEYEVAMGEFVMKVKTKKVYQRNKK
jgi:hypothetical protein